MYAGIAMSVWLGAGTALGAEGFGWVLADQPSTIFTYAPPGSVQENSAGWWNTVQRWVGGHYQVRLPQLGLLGEPLPFYDDGNTQVTAYGADANYCKLDHVTSLDTTTRYVEVVCRTPSGAWADSKFTTLYQSYVEDEFLPAAGQAGYLWHMDPFDFNTLNSEGYGAATTHLGTGTYEVTFGNLDQPGGSVLVTAVGSGPERCKVAGWATDGDTVVTVLCHAPTGALADSAFQISYVEGLTLARSAAANGPRPGAYAWTGGSVGGTTSLSSAWTAWDYAFSTAVPSGPIGTRTRVSAGRYNVRFYGLSTSDATALVTAYGSDAHHCKVAGWIPVGTAAQVDVRCFDTYGTPADSMFTIAYQSA